MIIFYREKYLYICQSETINNLATKPKISLNNEIHKGGKVFALRFPYDKVLVERVKKINGVRWSQSKKCWYIEKETFKLSSVFDIFRDVAFIGYSAQKRILLNLKIH